MTSFAEKVARELDPRTPLLRAMDRVARLLFAMHYHSEDFAARYGEAELVELEAGLREMFESLAHQLNDWNDHELEVEDGTLR